jgi:hypothetical protein
LAIQDEECLILMECKATKFSRAAIFQSDSKKVEDSLKQVVKGLGQLKEFRDSIITVAKGLENFPKFSRIIPILVTFEEIWSINSESGRNYLNKLSNEDNIKAFNWQILSFNYFEYLQPHVAKGFRFTDFFNLFLEERKDINEIFGQIERKTGCTFKDSFMSAKSEELYDRLLPGQNEIKGQVLQECKKSSAWKN